MKFSLNDNNDEKCVIGFFLKIKYFGKCFVFLILGTFLKTLYPHPYFNNYYKYFLLSPISTGVIILFQRL